jgi:hypothetical protein
MNLDTLFRVISMKETRNIRKIPRMHAPKPQPTWVNTPTDIPLPRLRKNTTSPPKQVKKIIKLAQFLLYLKEVSIAATARIAPPIAVPVLRYQILVTICLSLYRVPKKGLSSILA